ncbi:hypothetical protein FB45DRAFT_941228 [Roridomyces roridus]|uniref:Anaphase-promoting complex subunit 5 domain-containing protein n=1 Tax=Roridomyces roridus TaxID=1738132 RepID=A0AAD7F9W0_9AGAR|nr:hypothetical protein FB45DRAFT_941228 [Roridomyces roridus]
MFRLFKDAAKAIEEAVDQLIEPTPGANTTKQKRAIDLHHEGVKLSKAGKREEALRVNAQAVELIRGLLSSSNDLLSTSDATNLRMVLVKTLRNMGLALAQAGVHEDSIKLYREAADVARTLPPSTDELSAALRGMAKALRALGRLEEADKADQKAIRVWRNLAAKEPSDPDALEHLAGALNDWGVALGQEHRAKDAIPPAEEAVQLFRQLAETSPSPETVDRLAVALNSLGGHLTAVGRFDEALTRGQEVLDLRRSAGAPAQLASALHNISSLYWDVGRNGNALQAIQEAVDVRRELVTTDPTMTPSLASSLDVLAINLSEMPGRVDDALRVYDEAVQLRRQEAARDASTANLKALGSALLTYGKLLKRPGRYADALVVGGEAVTLFDGFVEAHPDVTRELATALEQHALELAGAGKQEDAITAAQRATELFRTLAESDASDPVATTDLTFSLYYLGIFLRGANRPEDALRIEEEADSLRRTIPDETDLVVALDLSLALNDLVTDLMSFDAYEELGTLRLEASVRQGLPNVLAALRVHYTKVRRYEDALGVAEELVGIRRSQMGVGGNSQVEAKLLDVALLGLEESLRALGRHDEALSVVEEKVALCRETDPGSAELANSLDHLASELHRLDGREEEAVKAGRDALALRRALPPTDSIGSLILAQGLENLGVHLRMPGHYEESLSLAQESVDLFRTIVASNPNLGDLRLRSPRNLLTTWFAHALENLAYSLIAVGRAEDAVHAASESIELYHSCVGAGDFGKLELKAGLATVLSAHAIFLKTVDRLEEAGFAESEATHIFAGLTKVDAEITARSLRGLARDLRSVGRREEAMRVQEEVVGLYRTVTETRPGLMRLRVEALRQLGKDLRGLAREEEAVRVDEEIAGLGG